MALVVDSMQGHRGEAGAEGGPGGTGLRSVTAQGSALAFLFTQGGGCSPSHHPCFCAFSR